MGGQRFKGGDNLLQIFFEYFHSGIIHEGVKSLKGYENLLEILLLLDIFIFGILQVYSYFNFC